MALSERKIEACIRKYLIKKGWKTTNLPKTVGAHDADVRAWHPRWRKIYIIEVKGGGGSHPIQKMHNSFWVILGQILTRMDIEGNHPSKARRYGIGIPKSWEDTFRRKILKMRFGWELLKLNVFLVDDDRSVEERSHSYFLKK
jgi:hypothetical protein